MALFGKLKSSAAPQPPKKRPTMGLPPPGPPRQPASPHGSFVGQPHRPAQPLSQVPPSPQGPLSGTGDPTGGPPRDKRLSAVALGRSPATQPIASSPLASPATRPVQGSSTGGSPTAHGPAGGVPCANVTWKGFKHPDHSMFPRSDFSVAFDGKDALLFGGRRNGQTFADLVQFNPRHLTFQTIDTSGTAPSPRIHHTAVFIGRAMLVFGGRLADGSYGDDRVYMFTMQHSRWFALQPDGEPFPGRQGHACSLYGHAMCVSFGVTPHGYAGEVALFDLRTVKQGGARWQLLIPDGGPSPPSRAFHSSVIIDHKLYVFGGCNSTGYLNDLWTFDLLARTWTMLSPGGEGPPPRASHSAFVIDGYIVVLGGQLSNKRMAKDTFAYHVASNTWHFASQTERSWTRRPSGRFLATRDRLFYLGGVIPDNETPHVVFTIVPCRPIQANDPVSPAHSSVSLPSAVDRRNQSQDYASMPLPTDSIDVSTTSVNSTFHSIPAELGDTPDSPILNAAVNGPQPPYQGGVTGQIPSPSSQSGSHQNLPHELKATTLPHPQEHGPPSPVAVSPPGHYDRPPLAQRIHPTLGYPHGIEVSGERRGSHIGSEGSLPSPKDSDENISGTPVVRSRTTGADRRSDKRLTIELRNRMSLVKSPSLDNASAISERIVSGLFASDPDLIVQRSDSVHSLNSDRRLSISTRSPFTVARSASDVSNTLLPLIVANGSGEFRGEGADESTSLRRGSDHAISLKRSLLRQQIQPVTPVEPLVMGPGHSAGDANPTQELVNDAWRAVDTVVHSSPHTRPAAGDDGHDGARTSPTSSATHSFPMSSFSEQQIQAIGEDPIKAKLLQALVTLHRDAEATRATVTTLTQAAVERISEAERSRQNALQEALYLRTKWQAVEADRPELLQRAEAARGTHLERQLANLINDNNALRTQLREAHAQLELAHQRFNDAHRAQDEARSESSQIRQIYEAARAELTALAESHEGCTHDREAHVNELEELRARVRTLTEEAEAAQHELGALRASDRRTQAVVASTVEATNAANARVAALQDQLDRARGEVASLEAAQLSLQQELERQSAALQRATTRADEASEQRTAAETQLNSFRALATLVEESDMKEEAIARLEEQLDRAQSRSRSLETELRSVRSQETAGMGDTNGRLSVAALQHRLRTMEARYLESQRDLGRTKHEWVTLRQSLHEADQKRAAAETQLQRKTTQLEDALTKVRAFMILLQESAREATGHRDTVSAPASDLVAQLAALTPHQPPVSVGPMLDIVAIRNVILNLDTSDDQARQSDYGHTQVPTTNSVMSTPERSGKPASHSSSSLLTPASTPVQ
ncbi:hypothetical protein IWQ60_006681 [Tieghemiomyces parasiticus]|uniref:Uncharacterized protein n=1 Tax=Tieghemiomyces parasiticus TaxID=78921 RepID=A0A9W8AC11_9FUNG|nr:hypothetical protein IWQ60_006681 [Tieghemiomyces parasiticus]